ncbi:hypothetical protein [Roseiarcus sp.]|uniref:hypothetical protein n=1 Tax=Roseiarcus sp. TaxID=1969460 RepID=UPI003F988E70
MFGSDEGEQEQRTGDMVAARVTKWALAFAAICGSASVAAAQQADNPIKSVMKIIGFATDAPKAQDFVVQSRPQKDPDYIPIFQPPPEPARPALKDKDLSALKGDLDSVEKRADAVRSAFPPAAKAVAEQQADAKKAKSTPASAGQ